MGTKLRLFFIIALCACAVQAMAGTGIPGKGGLWISGVHSDSSSAFSVDPGSLDFGNVFVSTVFTETVTVSNNSSKALFISSVTVDSGEFSVIPTSGTIDPFGSMLFFVSFSPTFPGTQSGNAHFVHNGGTSPDLLPLQGFGDPGTAVDESNPLPRKFALRGNYPNPFNPTTRIVFDVPRQTTVSLVIYNALGAEVAAILDNAPYDPGTHEITFNGGNLASGVYFYRFKTPEFNSVRKMVLLK